MLDSLKDLYICYPFMPVDSMPSVFKHIKDIRCVVTLPARNTISRYKNGNYLRAWLKSISSSEAVIEIQCDQVPLTQEERAIHVPVYNWFNGAPGTQSYVLVDENIALSDVSYELQPDTLLFIQKAPTISVGIVGATNAIRLGKTIRLTDGNNVDVAPIQNGFVLYGAAGVGKGAYLTLPPGFTLPANKSVNALGARSLNGLYGDVLITGASPVTVTTIVTSAGIRLDIRTEKI